VNANPDKFEPALPLAPPCDVANYELLFQVMPYGVLRFDGSGSMREANRAASRILGIPIYELYGRDLSERWQLLDESGHAMPLEDYPLATAMRTGAAVRDFLVAVFNHSSRRHVWLRGDVLPQKMIETGRTEYWVIFHDVTEACEAKLALMESRSHLDLAQRVASVGSVIFNYVKQRWSWSAELLRLYGLGEDTDIATGPDDFAELVHVEDREAYLSGLEVGRQGVVPYPLEFRLCVKGGDVRTIHREAELVSGAGGITGIIFTHKDITEAREAERQKEALQGQLYHAQRMDALGTLASGIAHDINNALVPIIGLSQALLAMPNTDPEMKSLLEIIEGAGARARDLVRRVLDFSRKQVSANHPLDLTAVTRETMKLARASVPPTIELHDNLAEVGRMHGDATQIHQLLVNLITNGAQAMPDARGRITVSLRESTERPGSIELEVADTGSGMDADIQKRIFEPFFTTKAVGAGTGLGLSVVHGIVRTHGGTIKVSSQPSQGTVFTITLPRYLPAANDTCADH
jgi:signal transduction histidine kinase